MHVCVFARSAGGTERRTQDSAVRTRNPPAALLQLYGKRRHAIAINVTILRGTSTNPDEQDLTFTASEVYDSHMNSSSVLCLSVPGLFEDVKVADG